ncbi:glutathione S-transferase [Alkalilimnicola ehrlichii]|uniref:glutathione S-transferase family protein n=1 Tax=Alkalilimnicola ehrlichii TaxID=351052 RepID=UPI000E2E8FB8|nr:glutathione S-transferase family protein [Alkalilimnicola ehrlichii]RFA27752.1 glutathione S-transferase [Alkalilimnicola ehrlichii]
MAELTLVIGNKNYSSWSLRPWLLLKVGKVDFREVRVPLHAEDSEQQVRRYSPTGKVPVLQHGDLTIWDSLAIAEYLAEQFPQLKGWPEDATARAVARSVSAEMHSEFAALRQELPMNCRVQLKDYPLSEDVQRDIDRICEIWRDCRARFGGGGPWLFGEFSVADAMFAPVALRFMSYGVALGEFEAAYRDQILAMPEIQEWIEAGREEYEVIERAEVRI